MLGVGKWLVFLDLGSGLFCFGVGVMVAFSLASLLEVKSNEEGKGKEKEEDKTKQGEIFLLGL